MVRYRNRALTLVLILAALLLTRNAAGAAEGTRWAIVVGIDDYMQNVTPLRCAVNDAREIQKSLLETADFKEGNVFLLTTDQRKTHLPTKVNIARWISYVRSKAAPQDTFLFFFSGHGIQMDEEGYLLTFEADPYSEETLDASCLSLSDIAKYFRNISASRKIIFADACRDDPRSGSPEKAIHESPTHARSLLCTKDFGDSKGIELADSGEGSDNPLTEKFSKALILDQPRGREGGAPQGEKSFSATFFSCRIGQRSYEWRDNGMGFFSYFLVKGLWGGAADSHGNVTISSLGDYLMDQVPSAVERERKKHQEPMCILKGEEVARNWPVSTLKVIGASAKKPFEGLLSQGGPGSGDKMLTTIPISGGEPSKKIKYTIDVIANSVQARHYDDLEHRIVENVYEVDKGEVQRVVSGILDSTGLLEPAQDESEANMWVFFNVCPTNQMAIDMLVRDRASGSLFSKHNARFYRPYPGNREQLLETAKKTLLEKFLKDLEAQVKKQYFSE